MRFQKYIVTFACIASLFATSACSMADEDDSWTAAERTAHSESETAAGKADHVDSDSPAVATCSEHDDCAELDNTAHWCSPEGTCRYACEEGFGDANGDTTGQAGADGCECELSNDGREMCDGVDNDCDGVVDNPFVGGQVAAGLHYTCAVDATGGVSCWGAQTLETGPRSGVEAFWEVTAGSKHGCALTTQGEAYCWGDNSYGQVGPDAGRSADEPVLVSEELRFVDIAAGAAHSCGLTYHGLVYCWGANDYGQLGVGSVDERHEPVLIDSARQDFLDVTAGDFHTCAARANGEVLCWGANLLGQTGQDEADEVPTPTEVDVPDALIFVEAGANHTCGLTGAGSVYCWGNNSYGQLGDGTRLPTSEPGQVASDLEFLALSAGTTHTCAVAQDGRLWCWGSDTAGQLGAKASGETSTLPHLVSEVLEFSDLAAGEGHTCALSRDGRMHCWGEGADGQLDGGCQ